MLRFWSSKFHFWRKSRRKTSFLSFKASILKEVSQKCFVFDLQSFIFEGSLAKKLRFWVAKLHFWRKSRRKASFLSFKASFFKEVSQKCLVFDLQSFIFEGSLKFNWHPTHLNLKSIDNQITSISDQLQCRITWISNQLTAASFEVQINRQPKSFETHIDWQPNHLKLNSFEADINWLSNHLHSAHPFPIGSLSLETSATALCGRYVIPCFYLGLFMVVWIDLLISCTKNGRLRFNQELWFSMVAAFWSIRATSLLRGPCSSSALLVKEGDQLRFSSFFDVFLVQKLRTKHVEKNNKKIFFTVLCGVLALYCWSVARGLENAKGYKRCLVPTGLLEHSP